MKKIATLILAILAAGAFGAFGRELVILHTNDTHSLIDPDADGRGGVLQRKAIIDSVRAMHRDVVLVDAGDAVQGTLYFKFFKGDVEFPLQNLLGVDISILGNHEFDNGLESLAANARKLHSERLSANYDFTGTPMEGLYKPYAIKKAGGKKIGFMGINIDPESLIAKANYEGMSFKPVIETANKTAEILKNKEKCDLVVAVTHIGYSGSSGKTVDPELAKASKDIDIIIGGHSHTLVDPTAPDKTPYLIANADGRPVLVTQSGKSGKNIGEITIDLDRLKSDTPAEFGYRQIPVTNRFSEDKLDGKIKAFLEPFARRLDSIKNKEIGHSAQDLINSGRTGAFSNWTADFGSWYGNLVLDSLRRSDPSVPRLDFAIMNVGGIRNPIPAGVVTAGEILNTYPFNNRMVIMEISGKDLFETMEVAARKGGEAVSREVKVVADKDNRQLRHFTINLEEVDPEKTYVVGTIDYVAWGNDDMRSMAHGRWIWHDDKEVCAPIIRYVEEHEQAGVPLSADPNPRFIYN